MTDISTHDLQRWNTALVAMADACGSDAFADTLTAAITTLAPIESLLIILESEDKPPRLLYQHGIPDASRERVIDRYFSRGYLLDPFCFAVDQGLRQGFYHLADIAPDHFFESEYYRVYYLDAGSVEDCYYILDLAPGRRISISLYNGISASPLDRDSLAILRTLEPVVRRYVFQHWGQRRPPSSGDDEPGSHERARFNQRLREAFLSFGEGLLTQREREVCHLLLKGHSAKSSARALHISPETVRMHRKNLYSKLDAGSQADIFSSFIDWLKR